MGTPSTSYRLDTVPGDIMREMSCFLSGQSILLLCCSGSRRLIDLLQRHVEVAVFRITREAQTVGWPNYLRHFQNLRHVTYDTNWTAPNLIYVPSMENLLNLPPTLRTLRMLCHGADASFSNPTPIVRNIRGMADTPTETIPRFDETLERPKAEVEIAIQWPKLEVLKLHSWQYGVPHKVLLLPSQLESLPSSLLELRLADFTKYYPEFLQNLPQQLGVLWLPHCHIPPADFDGLLPELQYLACQVPEYHDNQAFKSFPRSLRRMTLTFNGSDLARNHFEFFPPYLTELRVSTYHSDQLRDELLIAPLKHLRLLHGMLDLSASEDHLDLRNFLKAFPELLTLSGSSIRWSRANLLKDLERTKNEEEDLIKLPDGEEWVQSSPWSKQIVGCVRLAASKTSLIAISGR